MDTKQLLKEISRKGNLYRSVAVSRAGIDEKKRTVKIAFSSEEPYQRWFGSEILGHKDSEIDMSFIGSGSAPFLDGHDSSKQIGVIERAWVDQDQKGRAVVRFSKNPAAEEVFQDILDGIRKNISVGYEVESMVLVSEHEDEGKSYRVDKWTPLEASSVSIPADRTVGVGRENSPSQKVNSSRSSKMKEKNDIQQEIRDKELHRIKEITALGNHKAGNFKGDAEKAIASGMNIETFRAILLAKIDAVEEARSAIDMDPDIFSHRQVNKPSTPIVDAIMAQLPGIRDNYEAGAALENSQELARNFGRQPRGVFIKLGTPQKRVMETSLGSGGGYFVQETVLGDKLIDNLTNSALVIEAGATVLNDLTGDIAIPRVDSTSVAYFVNESVAITESDPALGQIRMTPHTLGARTSFSRRTMLQSAISIEEFLRKDLSNSLAVALDAAAINGIGAGGEPRGILNTTGIGSVTLNATNAPDWGDIVDLETEIASDNALKGSLSYMTNATIYGNMKQTEKATDTAKFLLENGLLNGYKCSVTQNIPAKYMLFGNWSDLIVGFWGSLDVLVDPYSESAKGQTSVTVFLDFDIAVRHPESFASGYKA